MVCPYAAAWLNTNRFFLAFHDTHCKAVLLARPVEAEIVFPLLWDSHQYERGQPHYACWYDSVFLGKSQTVTLGTLDIHPLYRGTEAYPSFLPRLPLSASRVPTPEAQA